jgi:hypothetical protein
MKASEVFNEYASEAGECYISQLIKVQAVQKGEEISTGSTLKDITTAAEDGWLIEYNGHTVFYNDQKYKNLINNFDEVNSPDDSTKKSKEDKNDEVSLILPSHLIKASQAKYYRSRADMNNPLRYIVLKEDTTIDFESASYEAKEGWVIIENPADKDNYSAASNDYRS